MLMKRQILISAIAVLFVFGTPAVAMEMVMEMGVAEQLDETIPTISVEGNMVSILGGQNQTLEVVSLTGRAVANYKIDSPAQRIELNLPKGCYILKIGKVVRKVTIR